MFFYLEYATVWILKKCILFVLYLIKVISSINAHVTAFVFEKTSFFGMNTNSFWNDFKCYATTVFRDRAIFDLFFF